MGDFDTVLERLLAEPSFGAALATDPARALAGYHLSTAEVALLHSQVTGDTGGQGAVETRANQSSVFGLLSPLAGLAGVVGGAGSLGEGPAGQGFGTAGSLGEGPAGQGFGTAGSLGEGPAGQGFGTAGDTGGQSDGAGFGPAEVRRFGAGGYPDGGGAVMDRRPPPGPNGGNLEGIAEMISGSDVQAGTDEPAGADAPGWPPATGGAIGHNLRLPEQS